MTTPTAHRPLGHDVRRWALRGAAVGLPVAVAIAVLDVPVWGEVVLLASTVLASLLPVGLAYRALQQAVLQWVLHGGGRSGSHLAPDRESLLVLSRPLVRTGAAALPVAVLVALACLVATGDAWPL